MKEMVTSVPPPSSNAQSRRSLECLLLILLAAVSSYSFIRRGPTAFEWPGTDMACFYERQKDPSFLPNDYYTNSIAKPNPRHVFGYFVVAVARVFHTDWYSVYFAFRVIQTLVVPMLWYMAMFGLVKHRLTNQRQEVIAQLVLAMAVILVMRRDVSAWFSIAWWPPYSQYVGAHPLAVLLGLVGIVLHTHLLGPARHLSLLIWFFASLVHPAIGLFMVVFYLLGQIGHVRWREAALMIAIGVILPIAILTMWFRPEQPISAAEFVNLYVISSHPFHYQVSQFATLTRYPWWVSFALMLGLMIAGGTVGWLRGNRWLSSRAALFALSCVGCVVVQYVGTDIWPSKAIASLGPSRFSFLGYYMIAILAALLLSDLGRPELLMAARNMTWVFRRRRPVRGSRWSPAGALATQTFIRAFARGWQWVGNWLGRMRPVHVAAATVVAAIAMIGLLKDDLDHDVRGTYAGLYEWIERNTTSEDVFLPTFNHALHKQLPVIGRRALFASQTFPFREEAIREHICRLSLAYGTPEQVATMPGRDQIAQRTNYFRSMTPGDFVKMADAGRLDYVVVERRYQDSFTDCTPSYEDASIAVYSVQSFRAVQNRSRPRAGQSPIADRGGRESTLQ
ncbi:MAG: hypothetical protein L0Z07_04785 [Planctomycetes bacterium]|nr:hypothetical protein [Planctomycetota bacterium]